MRLEELEAVARSLLKRAEGWEGAKLTIDAKGCPHPVATCELFAVAPSLLKQFLASPSSSSDEGGPDDA